MNKSVHGTGLNKKRPSALEIKASSAIKTLKIVRKGKYNGWGAGEVFTFPLVLVAPPPLPPSPQTFFNEKGRFRTSNKLFFTGVRTAPNVSPKQNHETKPIVYKAP